MRWLSLPVRVAAGLTATALEQTRKLPSHLTGLPVTITSQALQVSMRVQQQITQFAIKGDEALGRLQTPPAQPEWATFDEDRDRETDESESTPEQASGGRGGQAPGGRGEQEPAVHTSGPQVLPGYAQMSIAQLRGKLRGLSESDLVELLNYENEHGQRQTFLQMLSRRLETVRSQ
ncbi:hypothetical protein DFQ14_113129 [Halopolyspora algeriensis]|uniref:Lipid droplet-associated protein n=1 Tax=Halopolyspora algeriensis TaxID=1500506 RepID=A0A368VG29_9ACTN|nr:lipid droplet-associated protein [Halopolyspora algeriensis]RCW40046.1 hypothetical protein DFQ14_113129 [Halopolyspora algeriensis]